MPSASNGIKLNAVTGAANNEPVEKMLEIAAKAILCSAYSLYRAKHTFFYTLLQSELIVNWCAYSKRRDKRRMMIIT